MLPLSVIPVEGESLPGLFIRLAARYHVRDVAELGLALNTPGCAFSKAAVEALATATGESVAGLRRISYLPTIAPRQHRFFGISVGRDWLPIGRGRRYCPLCLDLAPHHRAIWDLAVLPICTVHQVFLLDRCPGCRRWLPWANASITDCRCGFDLRRTAPVPATDIGNLADLQNLVQAGAPPGAWPALETAAECLELVVATGLRLADIPARRGVKFLWRQQPRVLASAIQCGVECVREWPRPLITDLERRAELRHQRSGRFGLVKTFGQDIAEWLADLPHTGHGALIRHAIRNRIEADERLRLELAKCGLFGEGEFQVQEQITLSAASRRMRCGFETIKKAAEDGRVRVLHSGNRGEPTSVAAADVLAMAAAKNGLLTLTEAARRLGTTRARVSTLVRAGVLKAGARCGRDRGVPVSAAANLLGALDAAVSSPHGATALIDTSAAAACLRRAGIDFPAMVRLILDGQLPPATIEPNARGFASLRFDRTAVTNLAAKNMPDSAALPLNQAARRLGLKWEVAAHLAKRQLLPTLRAGRGRVVRNEGLTEFQARFITAAEIARRMSISSSRVRQQCRELGIRPVAGPSVDGCRQYVYLRDEINDVAQDY